MHREDREDITDITLFRHRSLLQGNSSYPLKDTILQAHLLLLYIYPSSGNIALNKRSSTLWNGSLILES